MPSDTLGDRLRHAREAAGLSQRTLAERAGVRQQTLTKIETGATVPRVDTLVALAAAAGVDPGELVSGLRPDAGT